MAFTPTEQARLGEIYAPILFQFGNDVAPISPAEFVRRSALWSNSRPDRAFKSAWGEEAVPNPLPIATLPRVPELPPGAIAGNADDPDAANRTVLGEHLDANADPGFFLGHGGWHEDVPPEEFDVQSLPEVGEVTEDSLNLVGAVTAARRRWRHTQPFAELDPQIGWYTVEAFDTINDLLEPLNKLITHQDPAAEDLFRVFAAAPGRYWLIFYHFFYPAHIAGVSRCEFIATLQALDIELPPDIGGWLDFWGLLDENGPGIQFDSRGLQLALHERGVPFALPRADRLGDFVSICVVAPGFGEGFGQVLEVPEDQFEPPSFVGFGRKTAAMDVLTGADGVPRVEPVTVPLMEIASADEFELVGNHPKVFVSLGTHNLYPGTGARARPVDATRDTICELLDVGSEDQPPIDEGQRDKFAAVTCLSKLGTLGILFGAISCAFEATRDSAPDAPVDVLPEEPGDEVPSEEGARLVLAPPDLVEQFEVDEPATPQSAVEVRAWAGTAEARVLDRTFEEPRLSWGPPALQDPFLKRTGQPMPQFLGAFVRAFGSHLAGE